MVYAALLRDALRYSGTVTVQLAGVVRFDEAHSPQSNFDIWTHVDVKQSPI